MNMTLHEAKHCAMFKLINEISALASCRPGYLNEAGQRHLAELRTILNTRLDERDAEAERAVDHTTIADWGGYPLTWGDEG